MDDLRLNFKKDKCAFYLSPTTNVSQYTLKESCPYYENVKLALEIFERETIGKDCWVGFIYYINENRFKVMEDRCSGISYQLASFVEFIINKEVSKLNTKQKSNNFKN